MGKNFYINDIFFVEPDANLVTNKVTGEKSQLEAKLMQVLTILVENPGKTVTRDEMVTAVWKDYGGGDEGLTQAISILRKTLSDTGKVLIQTISKKGYVFNAVIRYENDDPKGSTEVRKSTLGFGKKWMVGLTAVIVVCGFMLFFKIFPKEDIRSKSTKIPYPTNLTLEDSLEENETNTITTRASDSTLYKLVVIGDRPPKFYINNKRIMEGDWEPYMDLINSLKRKLREDKKIMQ